MLPANVDRLPDLLECAPKPSHSGHFSTYNFPKHQIPQPFDVLHAIPDDLRIMRRRPYQAPSSFAPNGKENIPAGEWNLDFSISSCYISVHPYGLFAIKHVKDNGKEVERPFSSRRSSSQFCLCDCEKWATSMYMYTCTSNNWEKYEHHEILKAKAENLIQTHAAKPGCLAANPGTSLCGTLQPSKKRFCWQKENAICNPASFFLHLWIWRYMASVR